jgi:hypothetical protein
MSNRHKPMKGINSVALAVCVLLPLFLILTLLPISPILRLT